MLNTDDIKILLAIIDAANIPGNKALTIAMLQQKLRDMANTKLPVPPVKEPKKKAEDK